MKQAGPFAATLGEENAFCQEPQGRQGMWSEVPFLPEGPSEMGQEASPEDLALKSPKLFLARHPSHVSFNLSPPCPYSPTRQGAAAEPAHSNLGLAQLGGTTM